MANPVKPSVSTSAAAPATSEAKPRKKRSSSVPENETKAERFRRLAIFRMNKALKLLDRIQTLTNKNAYEFTAEQAEKIVSTLTQKLVAIRNGFAGASKGEEKWSL